MKFLSLFFATAILFLTIKPGIDFIAFSESEVDCCGIDVCAMEEDTHSESAPHEDCADELCNPFKPCCNNVLYHKNSNVLIQASELNISKKPVFFYNSIFKSDYENSFWQPPKIV